MNGLGGAPSHGHTLLQALGRLILRLLGWHLAVHLPNEPKIVIAAAPHTSNWDGVVGISAIFALGIRVNWFAKDSLFRWPFKGILVALGGVPIRRDAPGGVVEQTTRIFASRERIWVGVAPEGTRSRAPEWKSGFYRIAMATGSPILPAYMDYAKREIGTGPLLRPSGDYAADLEILQAYFRNVPPKHPERFAAER
jgi:1-acyl-sn-glycerol-3-phosphate acyltransferase